MYVSVLYVFRRDATPTCKKELPCQTGLLKGIKGHQGKLSPNLAHISQSRHCHWDPSRVLPGLRLPAAIADTVRQDQGRVRLNRHQEVLDGPLLWELLVLDEAWLWDLPWP